MSSTHGLKVWTADGILVLDTSDSLTRIIDIITISGTGAVSATGLGTGRPWFAVLDPILGSGDTIPPDVTISGTTISWAIATAESGTVQRSVILMYGVY